jgi:hypothetical protein
MTAILLASILSVEVGPFNLQGRFVDLAPEEMEWGIPADGAQFGLSLSSAQMSSIDSNWKFKIDKASGSIGGAFKFADGKLEGSVKFENGNSDLAGVRLDITGATETYNAKDKDGNPIQSTRFISVKEDSPILFGDLMDSDKTASFAMAAKGITWKRETVKIDANFQLSGFMFSRAMFPEHARSNLAFDPKGRLLVGSAQQMAIYRANIEKASLEVLASTPDYKSILSVSPVDGTITYSFLNSHEYHSMSAGGTDKGTLGQVEDVAGMIGSPSYSAYDGKGRLYVTFGNTVAQMNGDRPAFVLKEANGFSFEDYPRIAVAKDGTLFVGSGSNIFRFAEGGKTPKKIIQGPDWKPGRIHGTDVVAYDDRNRTIWVGSNTEDEYLGRVDSFDRDGRYLCSLGRGGAKVPEVNTFWPGQCPFPCSIAVSPEGNVYVANYEGGHSVMEFIPIRSSSPAQ